MKQSRRWYADAGWWAALVLLLVLGFWWIPGRRGGAEDSFSAAAGGKKAFFTLAQQLLRHVTRYTEGAFPPKTAADTICILGPQRYPDATDWQRLHSWVLWGNTLVFAARHNDPVVDLGAFGVRVAPDHVIGAAKKRQGKKSEDEEADQAAEAASFLFRKRTITTTLADGKFEWQSMGHVDVGSSNADVLVASDGKPQVIRKTVGKGLLILASSDYIFTNRSLATDDNGLLAFRILESGDPQVVSFDESLNASGTPKVVGILFEPLFRPITLQVMVCMILFGWLGSRRFGPPVVRTEAEHRSISEHAVALGNLHFKAGTGARAAQWYLDFFRNELRLHYATASGGQEATLLARRANMEERAVAQLLAEAREVTTSPRVSDARAAALMRALAAIKQQLDRKGTSRQTSNET